MKKRLSLLVALVMALTMFATNAFAASNISMSADVTEVEAGDSVVVTIAAPDADIKNLQFALKYNSDVFTCDKAVSKSLALDEDGELEWPKATVSIGDGSIGYAAATDELMPLRSDLTLLTATFTVKDNATGGSYTFEMDDFKVTDGSGVTKASAVTVNVKGPVDVNNAVTVEDNQAVVFTGSVQEPVISANGIAANAYTVTYTTDDGELKGGKPYGAGNYTVTVTGVEANGAFGEFTRTFTITKATQSVTADDATLSFGTVEDLKNYLKGHQFGEIVWTSSNPDVATVDEDGNVTMTGAAGEAKITATVAGTANYDGFTVEFTITATKAKLVIKAVDFEAQVKDDVPALDGKYTVTGLVNGHTEDEVLELVLAYVQTPDMTVEGEYDFTVTATVKGAFTDYYEIDEDNSDLEGTLTVVEEGANRPPFSGNRPGNYNFVDIDANAYYYDAVLWAVDMGITEGKTALKFAPYEACTRAQMVTFLWRAAGCPTPSSSYSKFVDVNMNKYYADAVLWAVEEGITNGKTATTFAPNEACTRAQMATFLYRFAGSPVSGTNTGFVDVSSSKYYAPAVAWAVKNGVTNGTTATTFSPNNICTRAQMVTFLYRFFEA